MERWQKQMERQGNAPPDDVAVVLATEGAHGPVIYATNRAARLIGIGCGVRVVDVRAICPDLRVEYADVAGDRLALERLMLWARRWCPWTVEDGPDGLILDTTGSDHLMGGEAAMLVEMETRLSLLGLTARLAVAPTWGAAWALARHGAVRAMCAGDQVAARLAPLPVAGLRLDGETLLLLQRLGLKTIEALAAVPRLSLARRFVRSALLANPLLRLDQAMGQMAEPVASVEAKPRMRAIASLPEPIQDPTHFLPSLCDDLCGQLARAGLGCRRLYLTVYRTDGEISMVDLIIATGSRDAQHLHSLFKGKLDGINPGFGFDLITLDAGMVEPLGTLRRGFATAPPH
jgi:protein ImuB